MSDVNIFIIVNLGCEMLYVIDQRLNAQNVARDKSIQVLRDITSVLLDSKFLERLIIGSQQKAILTPEHCKFILNDIACCSLMQLDESSMFKLWDLITMVTKWQLEMAKNPLHLLEITFRHLEGVAQLYPDTKKAIMIDYTKNIIEDFWKTQTEENQLTIFTTMKNWFKPLVTKISILIRLGFQNLDGTLNINPEPEQLRHFIENIGDNIYSKSKDVAKDNDANAQSSCSKLTNFIDQLNVITNEGNVQQANIVFGDFNNSESAQDNSPQLNEFVQLETFHNASSSWENVIGNKNSMMGKDLKTLLNTKLT